MLQWMGGARRKMKASNDSKLKRQREFFDHRKEKRRRKELLGEEPGKVHTLADYIRQNLHGGESLDILGLRSLNPTPADVNTATDSDATLPDPATGLVPYTKSALRRTSEDARDVTPATSNVSASSVGTLKEIAQDTSSQHSECKIKSRGIIQEPEQEIILCAQRTPGEPAAAQQEINKFFNRITEIPLPGKERNPIHVGNLQTKKVASTSHRLQGLPSWPQPSNLVKPGTISPILDGDTPGLKLLDIITDDNTGDTGGKKRLPLEAFAVFYQEGNDAIENIDQGALHSQQTFITSDSVADWGGTKHLRNSSLQPKNSYDSDSETLVSGTSDLLSRFLSTQKLKSFKGICSHQHWRQPQEHNLTKDHLLGTESLSNSFRVTHGGHGLDFSDPIFNRTNAHAKEPREINFSKPLFDMEDFDVNQEPEESRFSDPFVNTMNIQVKREPEESEFSDPFVNTMNIRVKQEPEECEFSDSFVDTMNIPVKQERHEYVYLNPGFNTDVHQVTQQYPFLPDLSFDRSAFEVDSNFFD